MARILIVEDDKTLSEAYAFVLQKSGHKIALASNGLEALEAVKDEKPDFILLDLLMPEMNGVEFLQNFKPADHPETQIIVFSNMVADSTIDSVKALGITHFLTKAHYTPDDIRTLLERLRV